MYSLLIVDDEPLVQIGLASMLDWASLDVQVIGTAANGQKAYELIVDKSPDIVIADLRMPTMDGMELIERCSGRACEFIVLTSSEDFHFAQRAIRQGVSDYLIKLELNAEALTAAVLKAKRRLGGSRPADGREPAGAAPPFADALLIRLLDRGLFDEAARDAAAALGFRADGSTFMAAAFRMEYPPDRALTAADEQRLFRCTMDLAKEVLGRVADVRAVPQDRAAFAAVLKFPASAVADGAADAAAVQAAGKARELAANYFSVDLAVGLGERCAGSAAIADSYDEARRALEAAAAEGRVVEFRRLRGQIRTGGDDGSGSLIAALEEALGRRSAESFRSAMDAVLRQLRGRIVHLPDALDICCRVRQTILARMDGDEELLDSFFPAEGDGCKCLFRAAGVDGLAVWLETLRDGLAAELADRAAKRHDPRSRRIVVAVKKHLAERYAESLSLAAVAERFRISPNYLSSVFKRHEGIGFAEYLSELRIAQAKRLIGQRGLKVYEIAALVGFEDAFYFSKVFKRVCGLTPSEYEARVDSGG